MKDEKRIDSDLWYAKRSEYFEENDDMDAMLEHLWNDTSDEESEDAEYGGDILNKVSEDLKEAITKGELAKKEINRAVLTNWVHIFLSIALIATMAVFQYMKSWAQLTATIVIFVFFVIKILANLYGLFKNKKHQKFVITSLKTLKTLDIFTNVSDSSDELMEKFEKLMEED